MLEGHRRRILKYINIFLVLLLVAELIFHFLIFPEIVVTKLTVNTNLKINDQTLLSLLGLDEPTNFYSVSEANIKQRLENYALIKSATVKKQFPNSLEVQIERRQALASILSNTDEHSVPAMIDIDGIIYSVGHIESYNIPVISGLNIEDAEVNIRMPKALLPLLSDLALLQKDSPELFAVISEIKILITEASLIADIYLTSYPTVIRTDNSLDKNMLKTALLALEVLERGKINTPMIDMRTTGIVYKNSITPEV